MDHFYCCGMLRSGVGAYRRHMDKAHDGRSDCCLFMSEQDMKAIMGGKKTIADLLTRRG